MNECVHKLGMFKNILCSGPFKFKCDTCEEKLVRDHKMTAAIMDGLFSFMGIPILLLLIVSIEMLPLILVGLVSVICLFFILDILFNPLHIESDCEIVSATKRNRQGSGIIIFLVLSVLLYLVNQKYDLITF